MRISRITFPVAIVSSIVLVPFLVTGSAPEQSTASAAQVPSVDFSALSIISIQEVDAATYIATTSAATTTVPAERPAQTAPPAPKPKAAQLSSNITATNENPNNPVRLIIPSIGLDDPVDGVGIDKDGDMAVPSGKSNGVGWYRYGTVPGEVGSAVIDAHVFAAFSELKQLAVGADIYVQTASGSLLHFVVRETDTYPLAEVPLQRLFNNDDAARLNLITCAGNLIDNNTTYDHRLVAYAVLAS